MNKVSYITILFILFLYFTPIAQSRLNITVTGINEEPVKDVKIQVFPGEIYPDSNIEPIAPPTPRDDGLVGFVTNSVGKVRIELPAGDYTVVAFERHSKFLIMKQVNAPGNIQLSVKDDTSPVKINAIRENGRPLSSANIYFRPCLYSRGWIGLLPKEGVESRITPGVYHLVISGSFDLHYLVLRNQQIYNRNNELFIDVGKLQTAKLELDFPEITGLALYEILETSCTSEYVDIIEQVIGYDAAYTEKYFLALGPGAPSMTLSANLDYHFNLSYLVDFNGAFYAYEISPQAFHALPDKTYRIGNTGDETFNLEVSTEKNTFHPGDNVTVNFVIKDNKGNKLTRFFDYSGARLLFPYCTVQNPDGTVIADNSGAEMYEDFFDFSFALPNSARIGKYTIKANLDARIYGELNDTKKFDVTLIEDEIPPKISKINLPSPAEAGRISTITAQISDNASIDKVIFIVSLNNKDYELSFLQQDELYSFEFPEELAIPGQIDWTLEVSDYSGNTTRQEGNLEVKDTISPEIIHKAIRTAEIGKELQIQAEISDNFVVESASVIYNNREYGLKNSTSEDIFVGSIPSSALSLGRANYRLEARDSAGNIARTPQTTIDVVDTTSPNILHTPLETTESGKPVTITALISDNNSVGKVTLFYRTPGEAYFDEILMTKYGDSYIATIPENAIGISGLEYRIEAIDIPDLSGRTRRSVEPDNADVFSVNIKPRIKSVEIIPAFNQDDPLEINVGSSRKFNIIASDYNNQQVPVNPIWSVTNGLGYIRSDGVFYANQKFTEQFGRVIATIPQLGNDATPIKAETYVRLKPAPAEKIILNSQSITIASGDEYQIIAYVYDAYGNLREETVYWEVIGDIGSIDDTGKFTAKKVGTGKIRATLFSGKYSDCQTEVVFGDLTELIISPKFVELEAGNIQNFTVTGIDQYENIINIYPIFSVSGGVGNINNDGKFLATNSGKGEVVATLAGLQCRAEVQVNAGELKKISVEPFIEYIPISTDEKVYKKQFIAFGWDAGGNPKPIIDLKWQVDDTAGKIDKNGLFVSTDNYSGTSFGNIVINGSLFAFGKSQNGKEISKKSVLVIYHNEPEPPSQLAISFENNPPGLPELTLVVGEEQKLEATGINSKNQRIAVRPDWEIIGDVGIIDTNGKLRATKVGNGILMATYGSMTAEANLEVTPGLLHEIVVEPEFLDLEVGEFCQISVFGYDFYGNSLEIDSISYISDGIVDIEQKQNSSAAIIARQSGFGHIAAQVGNNIKGYTNIFVKPRQNQQTIDKIKPTSFPINQSLRLIYPNPLSIPVGKNQKFTVYKYSANEVLTELTDVTWQVSEEIGTIGQDGVFRAKNTGDGYVFMKDNTGYTASAYLQVIELDSKETEIEQIFIVPNRKINLKVGQWQKFYALGLEKSGKIRPIMASWRVTPHIAQIDALGIMKATAKGECFLKATYGSRSNSCYINIQSSSSYSEYGLSKEETSSNDLPEIWCESRRLDEVRIISPSEPLIVKAGEKIRFDAIGIDVDGNKISVTPTWSFRCLDCSQNIGLIKTNGLFIAEKVGSGEIVATVDNISDSVQIEIIGNLPAFARLEPDVFISSNQPKQLEFLVYDCYGNPVDISLNRLIDWSIVGDVGTIESVGGTAQAARFIPNPEAKDEQGEIIAVVDEYNLLARCKLFRRDESQISEFKINPGQIELVRGSSFKFDTVIIDKSGRQYSLEAWFSMNQLKPSVEWQVFKDNKILNNIISSEGEISTDKGLSIGDKLRIVANLASPENYTDESTVSIITGPVSRLEITNMANNNRISIGEKAHLSAYGYDVWNNYVAINPIWQVKPQMIGDLVADKNNCAFTAEKQGFGAILATQNGITQTVDIVVLPPSVGEFTIVPLTDDDKSGQTPSEPLKISAGTELSLLAKSDAAPVLALNWTVEPGSIGKIENSTFYPEKTGNAKITAEIIGARAELFLEIVPGKLTNIRISPSISSVLTKENQQFTVSFYDCCGNPINRSIDYEWDTTGGIGTIDSSGLFQPIHVIVGEVVHGTVDVIASVRNENGLAQVRGNATVTVLAKLGELASITLTAEPQNVSANSESLITIYGADSDGNLITKIEKSIELQNPSFGNIRSTSRNEIWVYKAPQQLPEQTERQIVLSVSVDNNISNSTILNLVPGNLKKLEIETPSSELQPGNEYEFALTGFDEFGNQVVLDYVNWTLSEQLGELIDENTESVIYIPRQKGNLILIAESEGIQAKANLKVLPNPPQSIKIVPEEVSLVAGTVQEFQIFGVDEYGNQDETIAEEIEWEFKEIDGYLEKVPSELGKFVFNSSQAGKGFIEISYQTSSGEILTNSAKVTVVSGKLQRIELSLFDGQIKRQPPFELISGEIYFFRAEGVDQYGNIVDVDFNWSLSGDIGSFFAEGNEATIETLYVGGGNISVSSGSVSTTAPIKIVPFAMIVGKDGGTLNTKNVSISIPKGALDSKQRIEISIIHSPGASYNAERVSRVYDLRPRGLIFRKPAKVTIQSLSPDLSPKTEQNLEQSEYRVHKLYFWDEFSEKWLAVGGTEQNGKVSCFINNLAPYSVMLTNEIPKEKKLAIKDIKITPPVFYAPENNRQTIEYSITHNAKVTIKLFDLRDRLVTILLDSIDVKAGRNSIQWDGIDDNNRIVKNGRYILVIIAESEKGNDARSKLLVVFK